MNISRFWVGCSGWSDGHWCGLSYPADLLQREGPTHPHSHPPTWLINHTVFRPPSAKVSSRCSEHSLLPYVYALNAPAQSDGSRSFVPRENPERRPRHAKSPGCKAGAIRCPLSAEEPEAGRESAERLPGSSANRIRVQFGVLPLELAMGYRSAVTEGGDAGPRRVSVPGSSRLFKLMGWLPSPRLHRGFGKRAGTGWRVRGATECCGCLPA